MEKSEALRIARNALLLFLVALALYLPSISDQDIQDYLTSIDTEAISQPDIFATAREAFLGKSNIAFAAETSAIQDIRSLKPTDWHTAIKESQENDKAWETATQAVRNAFKGTEETENAEGRQERQGGEESGEELQPRTVIITGTHEYAPEQTLDHDFSFLLNAEGQKRVEYDVPEMFLEGLRTNGENLTVTVILPSGEGVPYLMDEDGLVKNIQVPPGGGRMRFETDGDYVEIVQTGDSTAQVFTEGQMKEMPVLGRLYLTAPEEHIERGAVTEWPEGTAFCGTWLSEGVWKFRVPEGVHFYAALMNVDGTLRHSVSGETSGDIWQMQVGNVVTVVTPEGGSYIMLAVEPHTVEN